MSPIQAPPQPFAPFVKGSFWLWESINILVPIIGILFLSWDIFGVVYLFWWELIFFGGVGFLKILTASGSKGCAQQIGDRIWGMVFFVPLYLALLLIVFSFSFIEFSSETIINGANSGLGVSLVVIGVNYIVEYGRSELASGLWVIRKPIEVVFERFFYALPLSALVLFAVIPLAKRFSGNDTEKLIAIGIILAKFIMDLVIHKFPALRNIRFIEEGEEELSE
ncbi:MAG: hypothetical protein GY751_01265 [Bacteroidetes bacterium]|nr:hypothetical protein [Bacteroidota bacterium]